MANIFSRSQDRLDKLASKSYSSGIRSDLALTPRTPRHLKPLKGRPSASSLELDQLRDGPLPNIPAMTSRHLAADTARHKHRNSPNSTSKVKSQPPLRKTSTTSSVGVPSEASSPSSRYATNKHDTGGRASKHLEHSSHQLGDKQSHLSSGSYSELPVPPLVKAKPEGLDLSFIAAALSNNKTVFSTHQIKALGVKSDKTAVPNKKRPAKPANEKTEDKDKQADTNVNAKLYETLQNESFAPKPRSNQLGAKIKLLKSILKDRTVPENAEFSPPLPSNPVSGNPSSEDFQAIG